MHISGFSSLLLALQVVACPVLMKTERPSSLNRAVRNVSLGALALSMVVLTSLYLRSAQADGHVTAQATPLVDVTFSTVSFEGSETLVVGVLADQTLTPSAQKVDAATNGMVQRALGASAFRGAPGELLELLAPANMNAERVVLMGLGSADGFTAQGLEAAGGTLARKLMDLGETRVAVAVDAVPGATLAPAQVAAHLALGIQLRSYRFDRYSQAALPKVNMTGVQFMLKNPVAASTTYETVASVAGGVYLARDLVNEPGNVIYPATMAAKALELEALGVTVEVLDVEAMQALGMNALIGVGQGSVHPPRLVVLQWNGASADVPPVAFVGKGITFDSGGISLKPSANMGAMKGDMGGAAAVLGAMYAVAHRQARANVIGILALAENLPSANAQRPGDVVTSMSGKTIEIANTDAEGRLVLADALWYTQQRFQPRYIVDIATLTGAKVVALGTEYAALFSTDNQLAQGLMASGQAVAEKAWPMPLDDAYTKDVASQIADVRNTVASGSSGVIGAAKFLQHFVQDGTAWAHIDMAGMGIINAPRATVPTGGTGFGVRLFDRFVRDHVEAPAKALR